MTTALPINQQVNLSSLALETQDADLTGNLTVAGNVNITGLLTAPNKLTNVQTITASAGTTLAQSQSGYTIVMSNLAGNTFTLPASVIGTTYKFVVGIVNTSVAYKVITPASVFIAGSALLTLPGTSGDNESFAATSTTTRSVNLNGTTTGGATIGDCFSLICISATVWLIDNVILTTSGASYSTPFATS